MVSTQVVLFILCRYRRFSCDVCCKSSRLLCNSATVSVSVQHSASALVCWLSNNSCASRHRIILQSRKCISYAGVAARCKMNCTASLSCAAVASCSHAPMSGDIGCISAIRFLRGWIPHGACTSSRSCLAVGGNVGDGVTVLLTVHIAVDCGCKVDVSSRSRRGCTPLIALDWKKGHIS